MSEAPQSGGKQIEGAPASENASPPSAGAAGLVFLGVWVIYFVTVGILGARFLARGEELPRYFIFLGLLEWCIFLTAGILLVAGLARDRRKIYAVIGLPITILLLLGKIVVTIM